MFKRIFPLFFLFLLISCGVQQQSEPIPEKVYAVLLRHYNDTCGGLCNRVVFTETPCAKRQYVNRDGKAIKPMMSEADRDSLCVSCSDMNDPRAVMMEPVEYGKAYAYSIMTSYLKAEITLNGPGCTKPVLTLRDSTSDKTDYAFWRRLDAEKGVLVLYRARDTAVYPYYVPHTLDSFVYNLKQFCTDEERREDKKFMQQLVEKYCRVETTPNPFNGQFEFKLLNEQASFLTAGQNIQLLFLDLNGKELQRSTIEANKVYTFSFPDLKTGSIVFYRLNWDEYQLSGQLKKM